MVLLDTVKTMSFTILLLSTCSSQALLAVSALPTL